MEPVHVMAVIEAKPGKRAELLAAFKANVPAVHAEDGYAYDYHTRRWSFAIQADGTDVGVYRPAHRWRRV